MTAALSALFPVLLFIGLGGFAGRIGWVGPEAAKGLANLVFLVLTPALLFRTMAGVRWGDLHFAPVSVYFAAALAVFFGVLWRCGFGRRGAVLALASTFSNTVMIGIALVGLAFGKAGLVTLLTLISIHSLILLTLATVVLELAVMREASRAGAPRRSMARSVLRVLRGAILHPIPLPIVLGLLYAQTGWGLPGMVGQPLQLLGNCVGPLALILVGATLARAQVGAQMAGALRLALVKNLVHPALVAGLGLAFGLRGLPLAVMVTTAALPIGANVFMFSQRYRTAEELVTAGVAVSTLLALATVPLALAVAALLA
ncbi:MAG: AEC family transporter [Xylophilus ampelinus]